MDRMVTSLLETDLYKFSMGQAIYHQFPSYTATWSFKCRNEGVRFTKEMVEEIRHQIRLYCELKFTEEELAYLSTITWFKSSYIDFLRLWHPRYEDFTIGEDAECGLTIETTGTWLNTSMYEIPTLAIINEVYFRMQYDYDELMASFERRLDEMNLSRVINKPYSGTFVPNAVLRGKSTCDLVSVMLEFNKRMYLDDNGNLDESKAFQIQNLVGNILADCADLD